MVGSSVGGLKDFHEQTPEKCFLGIPRKIAGEFSGRIPGRFKGEIFLEILGTVYWISYVRVYEGFSGAYKI